MAGIYIHIPFCHKACHYCDFHFSTNTALQQNLVDALCNEAEIRKSFLNEPIDTIYFGGGTPSVLLESELDKILNTVSTNFKIATNPEVTLEANPDDISAELLKTWNRLGINRLSIGIQSLDDKKLKFLNRNHNAEQAKISLEKIANSNFNNFNVDLIYGIHKSTSDEVIEELLELLNYNPSHVSAYCLTIEDKTVFGHLLKSKILNDIDEGQAQHQYRQIVKTLCSYGMEHYEISNFAQPGKKSKHNSNYWNNVSYLGLGPSSESFIGNTRIKNISNNAQYIKKVAEGKVFFEVETLSSQNLANEFIMTSLRKREGLNLTQFEERFGTVYTNMLLSELKNIDMKFITVKQNIITLTEEGIWFADGISAQLFIYNE